MRTTMTNNGDSALPDLLSGQTLPSSMLRCEVPGVAGLQEGPSTGTPTVPSPMTRTGIALHAPYVDYVGSRSRTCS